jgi:hypothetical protein
MMGGGITKYCTSYCSIGSHCSVTIRRIQSRGLNANMNERFAFEEGVLIGPQSWICQNRQDVTWSDAECIALLSI